MYNKRGQQMTLGTIIAIVLGIAVLVFLIFGFSTGWSNLWNKITAYGGGDANVDTIRQACTLACSTDSFSSYCEQGRKVVLVNGTDMGSFNCFDLEKVRWVSNFPSCGGSLGCVSGTTEKPEEKP